MTTFIRLDIGGTTYTDSELITLTSSIGDNSTSSRAEIRFRNEDGRHKSDFVDGATVEIWAEKDVNPATQKIFAGVISQVKYEGKDSVKEVIKITARDYTALLQKTTVEPEVYTNKEVSFIVNDIMTKYAPSILTTTNVQTTQTTLTRIQFKQVTIFDALKELADFSGFTFYIDTSLDLHFEQKGTVASGLVFDETNVLKSIFKSDVDAVRNRVFVYGDRQLVAHPTETFTADGVGSAFSLQDPPFNVKVDVSGTIQTGEVLDASDVPPSGTQYLVDFHGQQIIFVSGTQLGYNAIPGSLQPITVDYDVSRPIIKFARDSSSISQFQPRTEIIVDNNIKDAQQAKDAARNFISRKKQPPLQGNLMVQDVVAITPGQTAIVNQPDQNVSNQSLLILEAKYTFNTDTLQSDNVLQIKVNQRVSDITDFFKDLAVAVKKLQAQNVDTTGVLSRLEFATGSFGMRVSEWQVRSRTIGTSFVLGHPLNGKLGSPAPAQQGGQVVLGSGGVSAYTIERSGGEV